MRSILAQGKPPYKGERNFVFPAGASVLRYPLRRGNQMSTEQELLQRAESGDVQAQTSLAIRLDQRGAHAEALEWLGRAANAGGGIAQHILGARLLVGRAAPFNPQEGARWVSAAAQQGVPEALALLSVLATLQGEWRAAREILNEAASRGHEPAREQLALLGDPKRFDVTAWSAPQSPRWQFEAPRVGVIEKLIPESLCQWIIGRARPRLQDARVKDPEGGGRRVGYRSNSGAGFSLIESDLLLQMVNARVAEVIGRPLAHQEPTNVLHYLPGEEYRPHFDFITPSAGNEAELRATGQRTMTVLIYLNDDYEGGETAFPELDWRFRGHTGDALVFGNLTPEGQPDPRTRHAGLAPTSGEKWLYSKWVRERPYPLI